MKTRILILFVSCLLLSAIIPISSASVTTLWSSTSYTIRSYSPPITADTTKDGKIDSLFVAGLDYADYSNGIHSRLILCLDAKTGQEKWRTKNQGSSGYPRGHDLNPLELYDVTGDGVPELFTSWGALDKRYGFGMACLNAKTGETIWVNWDLKPVWHHFVIIADKETNVPYIYFNGGPYGGDDFSMNKVDAKTGTLIKKIMPSPGSCNGGLSAADIDNNGTVEIFISAYSSTTYPTTCYDTDLNIIWTADYATKSSTQCAQLIDVTGPIVGQSDGILDVVNLYQTGGSANGGLNVIDGRNGKRVAEMSSYNLGIGAHEHGSIYDLDSDGYYEITTGYSGPAHVVKIKPSPEIMATLPFSVSGPPIFIDLVGDSYMEIASSWQLLDGRTFSLLPGGYSYYGYLVDVTGNGRFELLSTNGNQGCVYCYSTTKEAFSGLNTQTAKYGYRRLNSPLVYDPCPGTYWYSWDQWEADQNPWIPNIDIPGFGAVLVLVSILGIVFIFKRKKR